MNWKKVAAGSVKDLFVRGQRLRMQFSDRISVFDWGPLPDLIPGRGLALCRFAKALVRNFEKDPAFCLFQRPSTDFETPPTDVSADVLECEWVRHPKLPGSHSEWSFVPLEVIFRCRLAEGSSLLKREPHRNAGALFEDPRVEFTTKLEPMDRLLTESQAQAMTDCPLGLLIRETQRVARGLQVFFSDRGFDLWDGKLEWACRQVEGRFEVALVDAITPDELRLTIKGQANRNLSKELLRQWLSSTPWAHELRLAKAQHPLDFRQQVQTPVPRLGPWRVQILTKLYQMTAETVDRRDLRAIQNFLSEESTARPKVAVVGRGARESALAWRLEKENCEARLMNPEEINPEAGLPEFDAVFVSRDQELAQGLVDRFSKLGQFAFGPVQESARIESSKRVGRELADEARIPTPRWSLNVDDVRSWASPPVIKKIGLAAGKGVCVPNTWREFEDGLKAWSGEELLFEERLEGIEASVFYHLVVCGSELSFRFLGAARDFKRRFPGDVGPNTGGMGAQVPHPDFGPADRVLCDGWMQRLGVTLVSRKWHYNGVVFLGLMKDSQNQWKLLEFNARLGDPESEALVLSWAEAPILRSWLSLDLSPPQSPELTRSAVALVLVHPDYPETPTKPLGSLSAWEPEGVCLFRTSSLNGRVAVLSAAASSLTEAGDKIFGVWTESPWKDSLDWRPDVLP